MKLNVFNLLNLVSLSLFVDCIVFDFLSVMIVSWHGSR